jgi:hypothetical protein
MLMRPVARSARGIFRVHATAIATEEILPFAIATLQAAVWTVVESSTSKAMHPADAMSAMAPIG